MLLPGLRLTEQSLGRDGGYHGGNLAKRMEMEDRRNFACEKIAEHKDGNMTKSHFSFLAAAVELPSEIGQRLRFADQCELLPFDTRVNFLRVALQDFCTDSSMV